MTKDIDSTRARICEVLRSTSLEGVEQLIEYLDELNFFTQPASVRGHYAFPGGLAMHSLSVYESAMALRQTVVGLRPDVADRLPEESIAIAGLLHDICKADIYRQVRRRQKNEIGQWEDVQCYEVDYSGLPAGHGEKSVMMLLRAGLDLSDDEILAIRWHMGPWDLPQQSIDQDRQYRETQKKCPLATLIYLADTLSAHVLENEKLALI